MRLTNVHLFYHASMLTSIVSLDAAALGFLPSTHAACVMMVVWGEPIAAIVQELCGVSRDHFGSLIGLYGHYAGHWTLSHTLTAATRMHGQYAQRAAEIADYAHRRRLASQSDVKNSNPTVGPPPSPFSLATSEDDVLEPLREPIPPADPEFLLAAQIYAPDILKTVQHTIALRGPDWHPADPPLPKHLPAIAVTTTIALAQIAAKPTPPN
jgi:hypothetical protein